MVTQVDRQQDPSCGLRPLERLPARQASTRVSYRTCRPLSTARANLKMTRTTKESSPRHQTARVMAARVTANHGVRLRLQEAPQLPRRHGAHQRSRLRPPTPGATICWRTSNVDSRVLSSMASSDSHHTDIITRPCMGLITTKHCLN